MPCSIPLQHKNGRALVSVAYVEMSPRINRPSNQLECVVCYMTTNCHRCPVAKGAKGGLRHPFCGPGSNPKYSNYTLFHL